MSVGSIGGSAFNPQAMASKMAATIMKEADKDGNGTLSKAELTAFKASKGGRGPNVDEVFATSNTSGDGELTQSELQSSIEAEGAKRQATGGGPAGGPPPAAATQTTASSGGATLASSSSASTKVSTDPRDTNQDGKVSEAEIFAYSLTHPELNKTKTDNPKATEQALDARSTGGQGHLDISV